MYPGLQPAQKKVKEKKRYQVGSSIPAVTGIIVKKVAISEIWGAGYGRFISGDPCTATYSLYKSCRKVQQQLPLQTSSYYV